MAIFYNFTDISKGNNKICVVREASHIDFVNEKHHMDVSLETPNTTTRVVDDVTHSYRYVVLIVHIR